MGISTVKRIALYLVLPLFIVLALEPLYRKSLFDATIEDVPRVQLNKRPYGIMSTVTFLGEAYVPLVFLVIVFNLTHKINALYIWASFGFICYLNTGIMKSLYEDPRPFWVSENIKPNKCMKDYGNPSGHCMTATFFWLTLYLNKYHDIGAKTKIRQSIFCTAYIIKMGLTIVMILFFIFLAFSRVYLGVHAYSQVVFGSMLGITLAFTLHYTIKTYFKSFPSKMRHDQNSTKGMDSTYNVSIKIIMAAILILIVVPLCLAYLVWIYAKSNQIHNSNWDQRIKAFCGDEANTFTSAYHNKSLLTSGVIGLTAGSIIGQLFEMKFLNLNLSYSLWMKTNPLLTSLRIVICLIGYGIFALPYFFISKNVPESQIYYLWFFKYFLPIFGYSFALFAFGRILFYKLNLVSERSIGRMFQLNEDEEDNVTMGSNSKHQSNSLEFMEMEMAHKV